MHVDAPAGADADGLPRLGREKSGVEKGVRSVVTEIPPCFLNKCGTVPRRRPRSPAYTIAVARRRSVLFTLRNSYIML